MKRLFRIGLILVFLVSGLGSSVSASSVTNGVYYKTHVQNVGWETAKSKDGTTSGSEGKSQRLEGIQIELGEDLDGHIEYRTHVQDIGWESVWSKDGQTSGTYGRSLRLEGIQIRLVDMPGYSVEYRTHVQDIGWETTWAKDGTTAGTTGKSKRLEGIQIRIVSNKSNLTSYDKLLADCAKLNAKEYTTFSMDNLKSVLALNKVTTLDTQTKVDEAVANIKKAYDALEKLADFTEYGSAGTYGTTTVTNIDKSVLIKSGGVTLKNMVINGDLVLSEDVKSGSITLDNVEVDGLIYSRGAVGTITYNGSKEGTLIVQKQSSINVVSSGSGVLNVLYDEEPGISLFGLITQAVRKTISLDGNFGEVGVDGTNLNVNILNKSYLDSLTFGNDSNGLVLDIVTTATIRELVVNSTISMTGDGVVSLLKANADGITYKKKPTKVTVGANVKVEPKLLSKQVTSITLSSSGSSDILYKGTTVTLTASVLPSDATDKGVEYSIINGTGSATVSAEGVVTPTTVGTVTVRATAKDGSGVKAIKTFLIKEPVGGQLTSTTTSIPVGTASPVITVTLTGDTFKDSVTETANWTLDNGCGLSIRSVVRNSSTSVTLYTTGTTVKGTFNAHVLKGAMTSGVDSGKLGIEVYLREITALAIPGVTVPVAGAAPNVTAITSPQYTGTILWYPTVSTFEDNKVYTASIVLTAAAGYTLDGVDANTFTVAGASSVTHSANSGVVTATFPATGTRSSVATLVSGTLGTINISGTMTGGSTIDTSTSLTVAVPSINRTNAVLSLVPTNNKATISYAKNTGTTPTSDTFYTNKLSVVNTIPTLAVGDVVWVKVTAEDGVTSKYYKITVQDTIVVNNLVTVTAPSGLTLATECTTAAQALTVLQTAKPTVTVTTNPVGVTSLPITWSYETADNWGAAFNSSVDAVNVFRWTATLGAVTNTNSVAITGTTSVKSTWTIPEYLVEFTSNCTTTVSSINVQRDYILGEPSGLTKTGYSTPVWYTEATFVNVYDFSDPVTTPLHLYCKWTPDVATIKFNTNGGTTIDDIVGVTDGVNSTTVFPITNKVESALDGWYTTPDFSTPVVPVITNKFPVGEITYYAKWSPVECYIEFNTNGGSVVQNLWGSDGDAIVNTTLPVVTKEGSTFEGWYDTADFSTPKLTTLPSNFTTGLTTYYAKWS